MHNTTIDRLTVVLLTAIAGGASGCSPRPSPAPQVTQVWAWGANHVGQLGDGTTTNRPLPFQLPGLGDVRAIRAGGTKSLALKHDATVLEWGSNQIFRFGPGTCPNPDGTVVLCFKGPTPVVSDQSGAPLTDVRSIGQGLHHSLAIVGADNRVVGWGRSTLGRLAAQDSPTLPQPPLMAVKRLGTNDTATRIIAVSGGGAHTVALESGPPAIAMWVWGDNARGQLGVTTTTTCALVPAGPFTACSTVQVPGPVLSNLIGVWAGGQHTVALLGDGTVWTWGDASLGQLGTVLPGSPSSSPVPVQVKDYEKIPSNQVKPLSGIRQIAVGDNHTLALAADGTVWGWGDNKAGQTAFEAPKPALGFSLSGPVRVRGVGGNGVLSGIVAIAAGTRHSLAVDSNGQVYAWGANDQGQLGVATTEICLNNVPCSSTPLRVIQLRGAAEVAGGQSHTLVLVTPP